MADELVDILKPPTFEKTGIVKPREQALDDGDWIATFNLWILRSGPDSMLFQLRNNHTTFAPGKLDASAGGHYKAGETFTDGLREVEEELGKKYEIHSIMYLGPRFYFGYDTKKRLKYNIVHIYAVVDNSPLSTFTLEKKELDGLFIIPLTDFLKALQDPDYSFTAEGIDSSGNPKNLTVTKDSFIPENMFRYKYKMAINTKRILRGEKDVFI